MKNSLLSEIRWYLNILLFFALLQHNTTVFSEDNQPSKLKTANKNAAHLYQDGINAFKKKKYEIALDLFLQAQNDGYQSARLHYNIGITYFKLGNYPRAYDALDKADDDPTIAFLVNLNAGLVANKLGKLILAKSRFESAFNFAKGKQQQSIAKYTLKKLDLSNALPNELPNKPPNIKSLHANVLFSAGYIDNISLINPLYTFDQTKQNDYFASLYGSLKYSLNNQLDIHALAFTLEHQNESEYDFANLRLLLMIKPVPSRKYFSIGLGFEKNYLAGQSLQNIGSVSIGSAFHTSRRSNLHITYEYKDISTTDNRFDYLTGSLQRLKLNLNSKSRFNLATNFFYEYETNDRNDENEVISGVPIFTSHSPSSHKLGLSTSIPIDSKQYLVFSFEYRNSTYRDPSSNIDEEFLLGVSFLLPPDLLQLFPDVQRKDRRNRTTLKWMYRLSNNTKMYISYDFISNQSNIEEFTYNSRRADTGVIWSY